MQWYYIIYFAALSGVSICFINDIPLRRRCQKYYFYALVVLLVVFAGLRSSDVDRDYTNYSEWFNGISVGELYPQDWFKDPAFVIISYLIASLGWSYVGVTLIYAAISVSAKLHFSRIVSEGRWLTLFFYLVLARSFIRHEMTQTRAGVAIALMSISIYLAFRGRKRKAGLFYFLALLFHLSALIGFPMFFITWRGFRIRSRLWLAMLVPLSLVLKYALQNILQLLSGFSRVTPYLNGGYDTAHVRVFTAYFVIRLAALLVAVLIYWKRLSDEQRLAVLGASAGIFLLISLSANDALALRSADIFGLFELVVFMIPIHFLKGHLRIVYAVFIVLLGLGFFRASLELIGPYQWIFA